MTPHFSIFKMSVTSFSFCVLLFDICWNNPSSLSLHHSSSSLSSCPSSSSVPVVLGQIERRGRYKKPTTKDTERVELRAWMRRTDNENVSFIQMSGCHSSQFALFSQKELCGAWKEKVSNRWLRNGLVIVSASNYIRYSFLDGLFVHRGFKTTPFTVKEELVYMRDN